MTRDGGTRVTGINPAQTNMKVETALGFAAFDAQHAAASALQALDDAQAASSVAREHLRQALKAEAVAADALRKVRRAAMTWPITAKVGGGIK